MGHGCQIISIDINSVSFDEPWIAVEASSGAAFELTIPATEA